MSPVPVAKPRRAPRPRARSRKPELARAIAPASAQPQPARWRDRMAVLGSASAVLVVYIFTLAPTVTTEDSGELITAAHVLGVAHPPGYPLWSLLAGFFESLVPIGSVAFRVNLFSAVCGAAAAGVLAATLLRLGVRRWAAAMAAVSLGLSQELWAQSVVAEVYSLNLFFVGLLVLLLVQWQQTGRTRWLVGLAGLLGLGLGNHHTLLAAGVVAVVWVGALSPQIFGRGRLWLAAIGAFALGLSIYLYLPLRAAAQPYWNWGDPRTPQRFWAHFTRAQYPSDWEKPRSLARTVGQLAVVGHWGLEQFSPVALPLVLLGSLRCRKTRGLLGLTLAIFFAYTVGFTLLSNFEFQRENLYIVQVFYLPAYYVMGLWLGLGLDGCMELVKRWGEKFAIVRLDPVWGYGSLLLLPGILLLQHGKQNDYSHYWYAEDHARNMLASMEEGALIFPSGDHNTFPLVYWHAVEKVRPDITIGDKYGYVEESLYRGMPDRPTSPINKGERQRVEDWIIENTRRPVYFTLKRDMSALPGYALAQAGLLYRVVRPGEDWHPPPLWEQYRYRNWEGEAGPIDYGADQILYDYHFQRGMWLLGQGARSKAAASFAQAAQHGRGIRESYNNIGTAFAEHGLLARAIEFYRRALAVDPRYEAARWNLARVYQGQGRLPEAIGEYEVLARLDPQDPRPFGQIGFFYSAMGEIGRARAYWKMSLERGPDQPQILEALREDHTPQPSAGPDSAREGPLAAETVSQTTPATHTSGGPCLILDRREHDFGTLVEGESPSCEFLLENTGSEPLRVWGIETSCRCAAALPSEAQIEPGSKAPLQVTLKTEGRPGDEQQKVTFHTNDPQTATATLRVKAKVLPQVELEPTFSDLGQLRPGQRVPSVARIICRGDSPVEITGFQALPPIFEAQARPAGPAQGTGHEIDLRVGEGLAGGPLRGTLRIQTSHPRYSLLELGLRGDVPYLVDCQPRRVYFGSVDAGAVDEARTEVRVSSGSVPRLEVTARSLSPVLTATLVPTDDPQQLRLLVGLAGQPQPGYLNTAVELQTNVPEMPKLTLPVSALIR